MTTPPDTLNLTERAKQLAEELPTLSMDDEKETMEIIHRHLTAITRDMAGKVKELEDALSETREMVFVGGIPRNWENLTPDQKELCLSIVESTSQAELEAIKKAGE